MSSLRQRLKNPRTWLVLFAAVFLSGVFDSFRAPENQVTVWGYIKIVHLYQWGGRPLLKGRVQCRFLVERPGYRYQTEEPTSDQEREYRLAKSHL